MSTLPTHTIPTHTLPTHTLPKELVRASTAAADSHAAAALALVRQLDFDISASIERVASLQQRAAAAAARRPVLFAAMVDAYEQRAGLYVALGETAPTAMPAGWRKTDYYPSWLEFMLAAKEGKA